MKLNLRYYGDSILRKTALRIDEITPEIVQLSQDMIETMNDYQAVGLAAPQIGCLLRIYVFRDFHSISEDNYHFGPPEIAINPEISSPSKEMEEMVEGCLSLPDLHVTVKRPKKIHIRYQDIHGNWEESDLEGFIARVNMHENDHLNGVLHIDRTSSKERKAVQPLLQKIKHLHTKKKP